MVHAHKRTGEANFQGEFKGVTGWRELPKECTSTYCMNLYPENTGNYCMFEYWKLLYVCCSYHPTFHPAPP